jgi:hypothetical protein
MKRHLMSVLVLVALSAALTACALAAGGGNPNPGVIPLNAKTGGLTYADWGDEWWSWINSIPAADNPLLDLTGEKAGVGQSGGPVFFLVGLLLGEGQPATVERWVTVGRHQALFFPLVNYDFWIADVCMDEEDECAEGLGGEDLVQYMSDCIDSMASAAIELHASVDGQPLQNLFQHRAKSSQPFECTYPEYSIWSPWIGDGSGLFPINVCDGYWVMLASLKKGEHVVTFGGTTCTGDSLDMTYHVTVE